MPVSASATLTFSASATYTTPSSVVAFSGSIQGSANALPFVGVALTNGTTVYAKTSDQVSRTGTFKGSIAVPALLPLGAYDLVADDGAAVDTAPLHVVRLPFGDTPPTYWATPDIALLFSHGIVSGFPDGTFRPNATVTRAQFLKMLMLALNAPMAVYSVPFADVAPGAWYAPYVETAYHMGLVQGVSAKVFAPNSAVSREEMAVILDRALHLNVAHGAPTFTDASAIAPWAAGDVAAVAAAGLVAGFPNGTFAPTAPTTRAEATKVLALVIQTQHQHPAG